MHFVFILVVALSTYPTRGCAEKKVLLSSVQTLTFSADKFTTGRRNSPIPQLRCVDGKSSCKHLPSAVQCYNKGSDGIDVQWKCEAQFAKSLQFDTLQVQCEGYNYPDDPYILAGSCGLVYSLKPGQTGGSSSSSSHNKRQHHHSAGHRSGENGSGYSSFVVVLAFLAAGYAIYAFCLAPSASRQPTAPPPYDHRDDDANQPPPPPYTEGDGRGAPQYGFRPEYTSGGSRKYGQQQQQQQQQQEQQQNDDANAGRPGFWTGAALGGLAGYLFGNSGNRQQQPHGGNYYYGSGGGAGYHDNSNYGGGFGGGGFNRDASYSSSSGSDDTPVTQTGYASTRRR